ncbi:MAG: type IX secretion system outer membrane channel protein PorV [Bacteroidota bacterium]
MKKVFAKYFSLITFVFLSSFYATYSQNSNGYQYSSADLNTITTAVPFLRIIPDARAGGLGDAGISNSADANSQQYNPAKFVFNAHSSGISLSYSPWLRALVNDINLGYISGYHKFDSLQCIAASVKYFSLGDITYFNLNGNVIGTNHPYEFSSDISYSRKLSDVFSMGTAIRYIYSALNNGSMYVPHYKNGISLACDISMFYSRPVCIFEKEAKVNFGMNISNIGSKMSYNDSTNHGDFIPTNLGLGPALTISLNNDVSVTFLAEINKLLVPTPPVYDSVGNILAGKNPDVPVLQGMLQSFSDAPGGFKEEIREINFSIGVEGSFMNMVFTRAGFFYEDKTKGNRKFFTLGAGVKYKKYQFDTAYLITVEQRNPLQNTFRFSFLCYFN